MSSTEGARTPTCAVDGRNPPPAGLTFGNVTNHDEGYFDAIGRNTPPSPASIRSAFSVRMPSIPTAAEVAFTALQYLPMPVLVLSSLKTVVLANEAMGKMLGLETQQDGDEALSPSASSTDLVYGQSLAQLGIDMLHHGSPVWVKWEVSALYGIASSKILKYHRSS